MSRIFPHHQRKLCNFALSAVREGSAGLLASQQRTSAEFAWFSPQPRTIAYPPFTGRRSGLSGAGIHLSSCVGTARDFEQDTGADELIIDARIHDPAARRRSYQLAAESLKQQASSHATRPT